MDDKELGITIQQITEQMINFDKALADLRVGLLAVKCLLAVQMNPGDPSVGLEQIQGLEKTLAKLDPTAPARQRVADMFDAVKLLGKHGGGYHES